MCIKKRERGLLLLEAPVNNITYLNTNQSWVHGHFSPLQWLALSKVYASHSNLCLALCLTTPRTCEWDPSGKGSLCRCHHVKMRSCWIRVDPDPTTGVLIRRWTRDAEAGRHRENAMSWQRQRVEQSQKLRQMWSWFSFRTSRRNLFLMIDSQLLASRAERVKALA